MLENHFQVVRKSPNMFSTTCDQISLLGDLNVGIQDNRIKDFCDSYGLHSLFK